MVSALYSPDWLAALQTPKFFFNKNNVLPDDGMDKQRSEKV